MTRNLAWQNELFPEMFVEMSPSLAKAKGIKAGDWVKVNSVRGEVRARANVTARVAPFTCGEPGCAATRWRWWPCPGTSGLPAADHRRAGGPTTTRPTSWRPRWGTPTP